MFHPKKLVDGRVCRTQEEVDLHLQIIEKRKLLQRCGDTDALKEVNRKYKSYCDTLRYNHKNQMPSLSAISSTLGRTTLPHPHLSQQPQSTPFKQQQQQSAVTDNEMDIGIDGSVEAVLVRRPARVQESTNGKQKQTMQTQKQKPVTAKPKEKEKVIIPPPPPGVPEIQLRMWTATLRRRMHQLKQLSSEHLSGFANEIREDFMSSRNGSNEYSAASRESNGGGNTDLAAGRYSSLFLQENKISPESIGRHFLALFYRCIDNRLPPAMSKHGLDTLRRACASLDRWRKKLEGEKSIERGRSLMIIRGVTRGKKMKILPKVMVK